ncbi:uncharacterized protein NECHADRAFT_78088 [Fusarium vanettenii 77-13-4]|uniref:Uncharacterized protein n=1 Tax=Fusarium vanettenii (strain ATCC MYA-4622 / CBS 123669 / FGSC 9596 / NRRL 45880 / 77-13-4) TaxID=660122 RepID=C7YN31_FUSV7|nr:uncharacterized protein NECHADRAFT_78088 [Fusarium vanettenii 77-13-4]EEU47054.1 predicted protein [Fusarium vanettenii 77-13-4]
MSTLQVLVGDESSYSHTLKMRTALHPCNPTKVHGTCSEKKERTKPWVTFNLGNGMFRKYICFFSSSEAPPLFTHTPSQTMDKDSGPDPKAVKVLGAADGRVPAPYVQIRKDNLRGCEWGHTVSRG